MDDNENKLDSEESLENQNTSEIPTEENTDDLEERDGVKYETNDNWTFDAQTPTLNDDIFVGDVKTVTKKDTTPAPAPQEKSESKDNTITIHKGIFKVILSFVLAAAIIAVLVVLGIRYYTVPNGKEGSKMNPGSIVATIGDTDVSVGMYNYFFSSYVNYYKSYASYGYYEFDPTVDMSTQQTTDENGNEISWLDLIKKQAMDDIAETTAYYDMAVKAGLTLTDSQKDIINEQMESLKTSASESGIALDQYITDNFGEYVTEATLRLMLEQYYLSENYKGYSSVQEKVTDEEVEEYFNEHKAEFYQIEFAMLPFEYDTSSDDAKKEAEEKAKSYMDKITDRDSIDDMIADVYSSYIDSDVASAMEQDETLTKETATEQALKSYAENTDQTIEGSQSPFDEEFTNWLFSDDTKVGSKNMYNHEEAGCIYVILKTNMAELLEDETYTVRHILIADGGTTDETTGAQTFTDEEWKANEEKADKVLKEYENGDKTELSFALLAEKYSSDPGSISTGSSGAYGGLYEGVSLGEMIPSFEEWATDDSREYGDTGIVKTDYGYHIMFFINDCPSYQSSIISAVKTEKLEKSANDYDTKINEAVMKNVGFTKLESSTAE